MAATYGVRPGGKSDAIDGIVPDRVVSVRDTDEVADVVAKARAAKHALVVAGGATLLDIGNAPRRLDVRLELAPSEASIEHSPDDMVVTVGAGLSLARANDLLAASGQRLGLAAPDPQRATLGGVAAADFAGALAYSFGRPRDQVLGMTVVDGNGRRLRAGGRVVKNVAGYDLPRLFAGSYGTLGVITELTLRTHPLAMCSDALRVELPDAASLESARAALFASNLPLRSLDMSFDREAGRRRRSLHMIVEGTRDEVAYQKEKIAAFCRGAQPVADDGGVAEGDIERSVTLRFACRPSRAVTLVESLGEAADAETIDSAANGECGGITIRWIAACDDERAFQRILGIARSVGSTLAATFVLERAPASAKRAIDVWGAVPAGIEIMKRLKARFDPLGIFAPGRFVGGI